MTIQNTFTLEEQDNMIAEAAKSIGQSVKLSGKSDENKNNAKAATVKAREILFPLLDTMGLDKDAPSTTAWKKDDDFREFSYLFGKKISKALGDKVEMTTKGAPIFTGRVKKQMSRFFLAYKRGDMDGTQSPEDEAAKERAKLKKQVTARKAECLDEVLEICRPAFNPDEIDFTPDVDTLLVTLRKITAEFPQ